MTIYEQAAEEIVKGVLPSKLYSKREPIAAILRERFGVVVEALEKAHKVILAGEKYQVSFCAWGHARAFGDAPQDTKRLYQQMLDACTSYRDALSEMPIPPPGMEELCKTFGEWKAARPEAHGGAR